MSGPYVEQTAEPGAAATETSTQERDLFEESVRGVLMLYVGDGDWLGSLVNDIVSDPHLAALVAAAEERGAAKERERTDRVRELHRPVEADGLPEDCLEGECEHNPDGECPEVTVTVCADCDGQREALGGEMLVIWPCATIKALDGSS